jgi:hypothetical protein
MPSQMSLSYKDYDSEMSSVRFDITTLTAANLDATISQVNALSAAILAIQTENSLQGKTVVAQNNFISRSPATEKATQREHRWIVTLEDSTTHRLTTHEIPQADAELVGEGVDTLSMADGVGATFKSTVEALVKFPGTGNAVNVIAVHYSGKRA